MSGSCNPLQPSTAPAALSHPLRPLRPLRHYAHSTLSTRHPLGNLHPCTPCTRVAPAPLQVSGSSHEAELHGLLTSCCMLRRLKVDVLQQLPPKRRQRVLVELPSAARRALDILARDSAQARQAAAAGGVDSGFEQQRLLSQVCTSAPHLCTFAPPHLRTSAPPRPRAPAPPRPRAPPRQPPTPPRTHCVDVHRAGHCQGAARRRVRA